MIAFWKMVCIPFKALKRPQKASQLDKNDFRLFLLKQGILFLRRGFKSPPKFSIQHLAFNMKNLPGSTIHNFEYKI